MHRLTHDFAMRFAYGHSEAAGQHQDVVAARTVLQANGTTEIGKMRTMGSHQRTSCEFLFELLQASAGGREKHARRMLFVRARRPTRPRRCDRIDRAAALPEDQLVQVTVAGIEDERRKACLYQPDLGTPEISGFKCI